ncbi:MAG: iron donor protein CyaY [Myxococcales bacterium]|nr:iron donor protein CyaY [Myxococcales bacterium]
MLGEAQYSALVSGVFERVLRAVDREDPDLVEAELAGDSLAITARNQEKLVLSTQQSVRQIWVAGRGRGVHFSYDAASGQWKDDKGEGLELLAWIADCVREASGVQLTGLG